MNHDSNLTWECGCCGRPISKDGSNWCDRCLRLDRSDMSEPWEDDDARNTQGTGWQ